MMPPEMPMARRLCALPCCLLWLSLQALMAQPAKPLHIYNADRLEYLRTPTQGAIQKLIGHVYVRYDTTLFWCDSAWHFEDQDRLEAYRRVKMDNQRGVTITCDQVVYTSRDRVGQALKGVVLHDKRKGATLYTEKLTFFRNQNYGEYTTGGKLVDSTNTLSSQVGRYFTDQDSAWFRGGVKLINPDYTLGADTLAYDTDREVAYFVAPTHIEGKDGTMDTPRGRYASAQREMYLTARSRIVNDDYRIEADTLRFDDRRHLGRGWGRVHIQRADSSLELYGNEGVFDDSLGISIVSENPLAIQYMDNDTLLVRADTLHMRQTRTEAGDTLRIFRAYRHTRFWMRNLQGRCDSLVWFYNDSLLHLYRDPVLWSSATQITGDTVFAFMRGGALDSMWVGQNAFVAQPAVSPSGIPADTLGYDQLAGRQIQARFDQGDIRWMHVQGEAQSLYFYKDEKDAYIGLNRAEAEAATLTFAKGEIARIRYDRRPKGEFIPIHEVLFQPPTLPGLRWRSAERPRRDAFAP